MIILRDAKVTDRFDCWEFRARISYRVCILRQMKKQKGVNHQGQFEKTPMYMTCDKCEKGKMVMKRFGEQVIAPKAKRPAGIRKHHQRPRMNMKKYLTKESTESTEKTSRVSPRKKNKPSAAERGAESADGMNIDNNERMVSVSSTQERTPLSAGPDAAEPGNSYADTPYDKFVKDFAAIDYFPARCAICLHLSNLELLLKAQVSHAIKLLRSGQIDAAVDRLLLTQAASEGRYF